jgi:hypothetical protein
MIAKKLALGLDQRVVPGFRKRSCPMKELDWNMMTIRREVITF